MSEPEKQPEKVEIKPTKETAPADKTPAAETIIPAAANGNEKAVEPAASVTPVVDITPKKDPIVSLPVPPVTATEPAAPDAPVANDNATVKPATPAVAGEAAIPNPAEEAPTPAQDIAANPAAKPSRVKGFLKGAFNFAVKAGAGAAVSFALKTAAVVGAGVAGAPVWATILISGAAVGVGATLMHDFWERRALKKDGKELVPYFSKAHGKQFVSKKGLKTFGISTVAAVAGSMLFMGFHEGIIQGWWNHLTGHVPDVAPVAPVVVAPVVVAPVEHVVTPPAPVEVVAPAPVEAVTPPPAVVVAPVPCVTPVQQFTDLVQGHHVSAQVTDAVHRAASTNAKVAAQGVKDLAFYAQNGFGGVPKNPHVAVELFKQAADAGNVQAKVDLLYLQHYGLDGVTPDKTASLGAMKDIAHNARAGEFVKAWGGAGKSIPSVKFDTGTILKGMKVGCAA